MLLLCHGLEQLCGPEMQAVWEASACPGGVQLSRVNSSAACSSKLERSWVSAGSHEGGGEGVSGGLPCEGEACGTAALRAHHTGPPLL